MEPQLKSFGNSILTPGVSVEGVAFLPPAELRANITFKAACGPSRDVDAVGAGQALSHSHREKDAQITRVQIKSELAGIGGVSGARAVGAHATVRSRSQTSYRGPRRSFLDASSATLRIVQLCELFLSRFRGREM